MNTDTSRGEEKRTLDGTRTVSAPSIVVEYGFYFYMFFNILGGLAGFSASNIAPALLFLLFILCLRNLGPRILPVVRAVAFPIGCAAAFVFIQLAFYDESSTRTLTAVRPFLPWMLLLVIVQSLALRENFLRRFVFVMLTIGLIALPYISARTSKYKIDGNVETVEQAKLDSSVGFAHTNEMATWYGFCALYFVISAFTARKNAQRILFTSIAIGCAYVMMLTVSRGAVLAVACAILLASRHFLKGGFFPVLLLVGIGAIVVELGVFDQALRSYGVRGTEETGRFIAWPQIIDSFLDSPLIGVGAENSGAPGKTHWIAPHNSFLYLAQSSGVVPLSLFIAYWFRSGRAALEADVRKGTDAAYCIPLLGFTFVAVNLSGLTFMQLWAIVSLAIPMTADIQRAQIEGAGRRYVRKGESVLRSRSHGGGGVRRENPLI